MTNIIARVSCGPACDNAPALLVNAHYDTPLGSPGAPGRRGGVAARVAQRARTDAILGGGGERGVLLRCAGAMDDASSVGVMLEIVRALAYRSMPKDVAIIFRTLWGPRGAMGEGEGGRESPAVAVAGRESHHPDEPRSCGPFARLVFNGAEESLQDASHGFITQHPWRTTYASPSRGRAHPTQRAFFALTRTVAWRRRRSRHWDSVRSVLNLEACGHSGKAILFQVGAPAMIRLMANVPYPHGTVAVRAAAATAMGHGSCVRGFYRASD